MVLGLCTKFIASDIFQLFKEYKFSSNLYLKIIKKKFKRKNILPVNLNFLIIEKEDIKCFHFKFKRFIFIFFSSSMQLHVHWSIWKTDKLKIPLICLPFLWYSFSVLIKEKRLFIRKNLYIRGSKAQGHLEKKSFARKIYKL